MYPTTCYPLNQKVEYSGGLQRLVFLASLLLVDRLSAQNRVLTSNHDVNVPVGMEAP